MCGDSGRPRERRLGRGGVATPPSAIAAPLRAGRPREAGKRSEKLGNLRDALGGTQRERSASFRAAAGGRSWKGPSKGLRLPLVVLVVRSGDLVSPIGLPGIWGSRRELGERRVSLPASSPAQELGSPGMKALICAFLRNFAMNRMIASLMILIVPDVYKSFTAYTMHARTRFEPGNRRHAFGPNG